MVDRLVKWSEDHEETDTQGITADEWWEIARAALGLPDLNPSDE